jgi:hypothetical protein
MTDPSRQQASSGWGAGRIALLVAGALVVGFFGTALSPPASEVKL